MRPRENAKQVASERVITRIAEAADESAAWLQKAIHGSECAIGVAEVFKRIQRNDNVGQLIDVKRQMS